MISPVSISLLSQASTADFTADTSPVINMYPFPQSPFAILISKSSILAAFNATSPAITDATADIVSTIPSESIFPISIVPVIAGNTFS